LQRIVKIAAALELIEHAILVRNGAVRAFLLVLVKLAQQQ
jgi:hypothetical protein